MKRQTLTQSLAGDEDEHALLGAACGGTSGEEADDETAVAAAENNGGGETDIGLLLAALAADVGGPTVEVDLSHLTPEEQRLALAVLRRQLGLPLEGIEAMEAVKDACRADENDTKSDGGAAREQGGRQEPGGGAGEGRG